MRPNPKLLLCLARPLFPREPQLTPEKQAQVETEVVHYLGVQILAMPAYLRYPYRLALHAFNWLSCLRFGLPFTLVSRERQYRYVRLWTRSPIGLMRDFVKLVRSCVLLAYLDHPLVLSELERTIGPNDAGWRP